MWLLQPGWRLYLSPVTVWVPIWQGNVVRLMATLPLFLCAFRSHSGRSCSSYWEQRTRVWRKTHALLRPNLEIARVISTDSMGEDEVTWPCCKGSWQLWYSRQHLPATVLLTEKGEQLGTFTTERSCPIDVYRQGSWGTEWLGNSSKSSVALGLTLMSSGFKSMLSTTMFHGIYNTIWILTDNTDLHIWPPVVFFCHKTSKPLIWQENTSRYLMLG